MILNNWPNWQDRFSARPAIYEGGLRTKNIFKKNERDFPLISYVTVVKNSEKTIARTIESVQFQTYKNVEHIVVDGNSSDKTIEIIESYANQIDYFVVQDDSGLYNAMNSAVQLARGNIICILNSDDWLDRDAALVAKNSIDDCTVPLLLFTSVLTHDDFESVGLWTPLPVNLGSWVIGVNVCHNGIYATKSAYMRSGCYDESYLISADSKWVLRCYDLGVCFRYTDHVTLNYVLGGLSSNTNLRCDEHLRILNDKFPFLTTEEAGFLFWIFFKHFDIGQRGAKFSKPDNYMDMLRSIFYKYNFNKEFEACIMCAAMETLSHPRQEKIFSDYVDLKKVFYLNILKIWFKKTLYKISPIFYRCFKLLLKSI